jgi:hypothetical protein
MNVTFPRLITQYHVINSATLFPGSLRERSEKRLYCFTLTILWMTIITCVGLDWAHSRSIFILNNESPFTMAAAISLDSNNMFKQLPQALGPVVADGLLIWRCYMLWESKWIRSILLLPLIASTVMGIMAIALWDTHNLTSALLISLQLLLSAVTTLSATFLIGLKIFLVTRRSPMRRSYKKVMEILIHSAALVSVSLVIGSILDLMSMHIPNNLQTTGDIIRYELDTYFDIIQTPLLVSNLHIHSIKGLIIDVDFYLGHSANSHCISCCKGATPDCSHLKEPSKPSHPAYIPPL